MFIYVTVFEVKKNIEHFSKDLCIDYYSLEDMLRSVYIFMSILSTELLTAGQIEHLFLPK